MLAHVNDNRLTGSGMGTKPSDILGCWACNVCHDIIDGRLDVGYTLEKRKLLEYEAVIRTQRVLIEEELLGVL